MITIARGLKSHQIHGSEQKETVFILHFEQLEMPTNYAKPRTPQSFVKGQSEKSQSLFLLSEIFPEYPSCRFASDPYG